MGRYAQARKRGRGVGPALVLPAPADEEWEVNDEGGGAFLAVLDTGLPAGADTWFIRWRVTGAGGWNGPNGAAGAGNIEVGDLEEGFYDVQAAWALGTNIISGWSDTKVVAVTA